MSPLNGPTNTPIDFTKNYFSLSPVKKKLNELYGENVPPNSPADTESLRSYSLSSSPVKRKLDTFLEETIQKNQSENELIFEMDDL